MTSAVVISSWYTDEYKKLFALPDESELQQKDAEELFDWLIEECRGECPPRVRKIIFSSVARAGSETGKN